MKSPSVPACKIKRSMAILIVSVILEEDATKRLRLLPKHLNRLNQTSSHRYHLASSVRRGKFQRGTKASTSKFCRSSGDFNVESLMRFWNGKVQRSFLSSDVKKDGYPFRYGTAKLSETKRNGGAVDGR